MKKTVSVTLGLGPSSATKEALVGNKVTHASKHARASGRQERCMSIIDRVRESHPDEAQKEIDNAFVAFTEGQVGRVIYESRPRAALATEQNPTSKGNQPWQRC